MKRVGEKTMKSQALGLALALSLHAGGLAAAPITFDFTGTVTQVPVLDPSDPFGDTIAFGTAITGSYTFESTTPDAIPSPDAGSYSMFGPPFGMQVDIGGNAFSATDFLNIGVANNFSGTVDQYTVLAQQTSDEPLDIELFFEDNTGLALSSDALPTTPPPLLLFQIRSFSLIGTVDGNQVEIGAQINTLTPAVTQVPVPGTLLLLSVGLAWLCRRRFVSQLAEDRRQL